MRELERRAGIGDIEVRSTENDEQPEIRGYAAVFKRSSDPLMGGAFTEVIADGAFDDVLNDDVRALFNHDQNFVLGRRAAGTLTLTVDERGLEYVIKPPATRTVQDMVLTPIQRGDVTQSSFGFFVAEDDWEERSNGAIVRTIVKVGQLLDVSPVTYPAYRDTEAVLRSLYENRNNQSGSEQRFKSGDDILEALARAHEASDDPQEIRAICDAAMSEIIATRETVNRKAEALRLFRMTQSSAA